jgi:ribosomal protein S18 acetylase RimI-like enzyme
MSTYRFSNALGYSLEQLCEMHNQSFEGYFFPMKMTPEGTADFWRDNQIDARRCVVMHDEAGTFVGMARMGTRGRRGWCGGFGIVPAFRGTGAGKLLAEEMVRVARETGLAELQLEALTQNERAIRLYQRVGFVITRRLYGLEIAPDALPAGADNLRVERVGLDKALTWMARAEKPAWGMELPSILAAHTQALAAYAPDGSESGVVVERLGSRVRISIAALHSAFTDTQVAALFRAAAGNAGGIMVYNSPEGSPLLERSRALGFKEIFSQHEMVLAL